MLARLYRIPSFEIPNVLRIGKRFHTAFIQIVCVKNTEANSRFAFIVPTKVDKRAVGRNRIRRLLSESVRHLLPGIAPSYDIVFFVKMNRSEIKIQECEPIVEGLLRQAGLMHETNHS